MSGYREKDRYYDQQSQVFAHPNYGSYGGYPAYSGYPTYGGYSYGYGAYPAPRQRQQNYNANTVEEPRVRRVSGRNQPAAITMWSDRTWWAIFLLGIVTCGIIDIVFWYRTANDLNIMESRYDGKRTMGFLMMLIFCTFTLFFAFFVWMHRFSARVGDALERRGIEYEFGAGTFWGWGVFGILLLGVGPLVYFAKLCKAMNKISEDFNEVG